MRNQASKTSALAHPHDDSPLVSSETVVWLRAFFDHETESKHIPDITLETLEGFYPMVRGWVVDLADALERMTSSNRAIGAMRVYADTVVVPDHWNPDALECPLIIAARLMVVGKEATLPVGLTVNDDAQVLLCTKHLHGSLALPCRWTSATGQAGRGEVSRRYEFAPPVTGAGMHLWQPDPDADPVVEPLAIIPPDLTARARPLYRLLLGTYQAATVLLSTGRANDASDFADWIRRYAASSDELVSLGIDAATLEMQAQTIATAAPFAPRLSVGVYQSLSKNYIDALAAHEDKAEKLALMDRIDSGFRETAISMLSEAENAVTYDERLIDQTLTAFRQTERGVHEMEGRLKDRLRTIELLKIDIEAEAQKHLYDAILKAAFDISVQIVTSAISIGTAVAGAVATGGATAPAAVLTVGGKLVEAGEIAIKVGEGVTKVTFSEKEVGEANDFSKLKDGAEAGATSLIEFCKMVYQIYKIINTVVDSASRTSQIGKCLEEGGFDKAAVTELTGAYSWDLMKIASRTALKAPLAMGLPSAEALRDEIDALAVEGRALSAQRTTLLDQGQELARLAWRQEMARSRVEELRSRLVREDQDHEMMEDVADWARVEAASIKRGIFTALFDYTRAYFYWSLTPSSITPSMIEDSAGYRKLLSAMETEKTDALTKGFTPAPQTFTNKDITVTSPDRLGALKRGERVIISVGENEPLFNDFSRVRVERVRAWLDGVQGDGAPVLIEIRSAGTFSDRMGDQSYLFTSNRFLVTFQYQTGKGEDGILTDGVVARREQDLYFLPTPFTDWSIEIKQGIESGIDTSGLKALRLSFSGSHIYTPGVGEASP